MQQYLKPSGEAMAHFHRDHIRMYSLGSSTPILINGITEVEFDSVEDPHPHGPGFVSVGIYDCIMCGKPESDFRHEQKQTRLI